MNPDTQTPIIRSAWHRHVEAEAAPGKTYGERVAAELAARDRDRRRPRLAVSTVDRPFTPRTARRRRRRRPADPLADAVTRCRRRALAVARRITGDREAAAEAVGDATVRAVELRPRFARTRDPGRLYLWLVRLAARDHARRRRRPARPIGPAAAAALAVAPWSADPARQVAEAEAVARVRSAVAGLHRRKREALERHALAGEPRAAAAAAMGCGPMNVSQLVWQARVAVRDALGLGPVGRIGGGR